MQSRAEHAEIPYGRCTSRRRGNGILGELDRAGLLHREVSNVLGMTLPELLAAYDITLTKDDAVKRMYSAGPAGIRTTKAFSQDCRWPSRMTTAKTAVSAAKPCLQPGWRAGGTVRQYCRRWLYCENCGVDEGSLTFTGPAKVYESQDDAVRAILGGDVVAGMWW